MWPSAVFTYEHKKVKFPRYRPGVAQRVGRGIALLFHDRGTRTGWVVSSTPRPHFTPGKDPVPILQEAGWAQGRSGQAENLIFTGIRSRTVWTVVSRYTDWATRPAIYEYNHDKTTSYRMWPLIFFFVNIVTEICFVHESGHGIFFLQQCDHRQFLFAECSQGVSFFYKCGLYSFPHEWDHWLFLVHECDHGQFEECGDGLFFFH